MSGMSEMENYRDTVGSFRQVSIEALTIQTWIHASALLGLP